MSVSLRYRRIITKPERAKLHKRPQGPPVRRKSRLHLYALSSVLVLVIAGYALGL
jgi:hypothetical protein